FAAGDLRQYSKQFRQRSIHAQENMIWSVSLQITDAVEALHSLGVIHCDLKPENVLVDTSGREVRVVVADFGLARMVSEIHPGFIGIGTISYHPPENQIGAGTDVWAIGAIIHFLATGEP
ncbi:kinase-like protein, partial [Pseudovirgaria hyperparasitica]